MSTPEHHEAQAAAHLAAVERMAEGDEAVPVGVSHVDLDRRVKLAQAHATLALSLRSAPENRMETMAPVDRRSARERDVRHCRHCDAEVQPMGDLGWASVSTGGLRCPGGQPHEPDEQVADEYPFGVGDTVVWARHTIPRIVVAMLPAYGLAVVADAPEHQAHRLGRGDTTVQPPSFAPLGELAPVAPS